MSQNKNISKPTRYRKPRPASASAAVEALRRVVIEPWDADPSPADLSANGADAAASEPVAIDDSASSMVKTKPKPKLRPQDALVAAAIDAATTPAQRRLLSSGGQIAVVVIVPAVGWIVPTDYYFRDLIDECCTFARNGTNRARDKADVGNGEIGALLAKGVSVVGIATSLDMLPSSLVAAADVIIELSAPDSSTVRHAIRLCALGRVPPIADSYVHGLDFDDLVSAMRKGSAPAQIIERLRLASASRRNIAVRARVPDLVGAVEYGEARTWGLELAEDLVEYRAGRLAWSEIGSSVVLFSPPGYGKTLFAQALAQACGDVPLVVSSVGELFASSEGHLGGVVKAIRKTFADAVAASGSGGGISVLLLDEIDGFPSRESLSDHGRDWWTPVLMDFILGVDALLNMGRSGQKNAVIVVAATNRIHALDPALTRPGRIERSIEIKPPGVAGVINILRHHLNGELAAADLTALAQLIEGSTPAEIMNVVKSARRLARQAKRPLELVDIEAAALPKADVSLESLTRTALHEAGHAVAAVVLQTGRLRGVKIRDAEASRGVTRIEFGDDYQPTRAQLDNEVTVALSGRAAEQVLLGRPSAGAGSDLETATRTLAAAHASLGLGDTLVHLSKTGGSLSELSLNPDLRARVERDLRDAEARAIQLVEQNRQAVMAVAARLVAKRHISGDDVKAIVDQAARKAPLPALSG